MPQRIALGGKSLTAEFLPFCSLKVLPNGKRHFDLPLKKCLGFKGGSQVLFSCFSKRERRL
jgi:hypothetical protein